MQNRDRGTVAFFQSGADRGPRSRILLRRMGRDPSALQLLRCVGAVRGVDLGSLLQANRGHARIARSRQLAMYLVHVLLGRPQDVVGMLFGRDRTTVSHACRLMEDRRDDPTVEWEIEQIESRFTLPQSSASGAFRDVA